MSTRLIVNLTQVYSPLYVLESLRMYRVSLSLVCPLNYCPCVHLVECCYCSISDFLQWIYSNNIFTINK